MNFHVSHPVDTFKCFTGEMLAMNFSVTFQIVAKLARVSKSIGKISLAALSRLPRATCYLRHLLTLKLFEHLQNLLYCIPIDAEFYADFKNVYFYVVIFIIS